MSVSVLPNKGNYFVFYFCFIFGISYQSLFENHFLIFIRFAIIGMYKSRIAKEIGEPRMIPIDKNRNSVAEYIG